MFSLVVRTSSLMTTPRAGSRSQGRDRRVVGKSAANVEPDVRVSDVLWDEQTERYRDWRQANQESSTEIFSESPCEERFIRQKKGGRPRVGQDTNSRRCAMQCGVRARTTSSLASRSS